MTPIFKREEIHEAVPLVAVSSSTMELTLKVVHLQRPPEVLHTFMGMIGSLAVVDYWMARERCICQPFRLR